MTPKPQSKGTSTRHPQTAPKSATRRRRAGQTPVDTRRRSIITHVTPANGNVFSDLGFAPEEAANLALRSDLMSALGRAISGMTQVEAAARLGVSQPRISELKGAQIDRFTIDALVNMLAHAGGGARLVIKEPKRGAARATHGRRRLAN